MVTIIIEGSDRSGKSTLINNIKRNIVGPWVTIHNGRQPDNDSQTAREMYANQLRLRRILPDHWYLFDRLHLSEAVYGWLYRQDDKARPLMHIIDRDHLPRDTIIVICQRPYDDIADTDDGQSAWDRYGMNPEAAHTAEQELFTMAGLESKATVIRGDPTIHTPTILNLLKARIDMVKTCTT